MLFKHADHNIPQRGVLPVLPGGVLPVLAVVRAVGLGQGAQVVEELRLLRAGANPSHNRDQRYAAAPHMLRNAGNYLALFLYSGDRRTRRKGRRSQTSKAHKLTLRRKAGGGPRLSAVFYGASNGPAAGGST